MKAAGAVILSALVFVAVCVGAYFLFWGARGDGINRQYQQDRGSTAFQESLISAERDRVTAYDAANDPGQKAAIKSQFCTVLLSISPVPPDLEQAKQHLGC